jgi:hypothetical protein
MVARRETSGAICFGVPHGKCGTEQDCFAPSGLFRLLDVTRRFTSGYHIFTALPFLFTFFANPFFYFPRFHFSLNLRYHFGL